MKLRQLTYRSPSEIKPDPRNPRKHGRAQIKAIAKSISSFGFNAPILVDRQDQIVAGHGRLEAAKLLKLEQVSVICLDDLTEAQAKAYMIADNKLTDRSEWDGAQLARHLQDLSKIVLNFDIEDTGFELPEIDLLIQGLDTQPETDALDEFQIPEEPPVSKLGDLWHLGPHRLYCGSALEPAAYKFLLGEERAAAVFTDPPYNVKIAGNVSGKGKVVHGEFAMASGEMTQEGFTAFLAAPLALARDHTIPGAVLYVCMDWRHMGELLAAGKVARLELLNVCIWVKTNGGMGSFYRSQHEEVFVFRNGDTAHRNNVQLGKFGRNRCNVWTYPGANTFDGRGKKSVLTLHPTVKPTRLVADAIMDCTALGDIVLDPFMGSGTTILAAEKMGRRGYGIELDPRYVDTAIQRWQQMTKLKARRSTGEAYDDLKAAQYAEAAE